MTPAFLAATADRFFEWHRSLVDDGGSVAPRDLVDEAMSFNWTARRNPERLWPIVTTMVDRAPDQETLWFVAAGPLEELVSNHGPRFLDRLEARAIVNDRFRDALRGVWGWQRFPKAMRTRLYPILTSDLEEFHRRAGRD